MGGISVTLEGDNIQLSFQKGQQTTSVLMDAGAARSLVRALAQLLASLEDEEGGPEADEDFMDVTSPSIDIGTDDRGQAVVALQAGSLPAFMLRLKDDEARHIANSL
ncbi:MAG TPA: hypothetical protein VHN20_06945, partial [Beijerinckiaceae bacterium]|nr:hypothetical protein [Beijerinckiaceae bacterium]